MRTALIHYWLTNLRGGEKVFSEIASLYPDAEIFTHAYLPDKLDGMFANRFVRESPVARLPFGRRKVQCYLPLLIPALKTFDFSGCDLILSSESGPAKDIAKPPRALHICYCHSPMRYLYDMYDEYYRSASLPGKLAMKLFSPSLRRADRAGNDAVDFFLANSRFVAERIRRIYGREATVIHPFVDYAFFSAAPVVPKGGYYLFVGQLVGYKRAALAIAACTKMNRRLVVVGDGKQGAAPPNVTFTGRLFGEQLRKLYAGADALLFPGVEDFGIVPLEAQAAGTPVIAFGAGGALETVREGETGLFFREATAESLCGAIEDFEGRNFDPAQVRANAAQFTPERFRREFSAFVAEKLKLRK